MTDLQKQLSKKYIYYRLLTNFWFVGAVWLYFYRLFISDQQIGILDDTAFAIGLLAEVPSGALADRFGRDKLVRLGHITAGIGLSIQAIGGGFAPLFISFVSGADEALFFDSLQFKPDAKNWRKLVTRGSQAALIGLCGASAVGGWIHTINPRIPWLLSGASFIGAAAIIWTVKDTRPRSARKKFLPECFDYLQNIKTGFLQFRSPQLRYFVPYILAVQGLFYATDYGLLRLVLLDRFGFSPLLGALAIASCSIVSAALLSYTHRYSDKLSEKTMFTLVGITVVVALLASMATIGIWGYIVICALYAGHHLLQPFMSEALNNRLVSDQRATALSVASFFRTLPYLALAPIIGYLNSQDNLSYFLIIWAVLIVVTLTLFISRQPEP
jgi:MFS family permease